MQPQITETDYKALFTQLIKKQMLVLGPDITLAKVHNVTGLTVDINGDVQKLEGDPQVMLQFLINQFVELSGMIVKKTMESILTSYPGMIAMSSALGGNITTAPVEPTHTGIPSREEKPVDHVEPPLMSAIKLDSLTPTTAHADKPVESSTSFSSKEMQDLNKALDELSKAPLSSESPPAQPQV